ncbi:hypothetical protein M885DRAFT_513395 [Pelagophyceae sp. CCMP2097]|nr:hypothetical protein M885DRAFT_513395 [Pelagophyceae sp. CCMP2097]
MLFAMETCARRCFALVQRRDVHSKRYLKKLQWPLIRKGIMKPKVDKAKPPTCDLTWNVARTDSPELPNGFTRPPALIPADLPFRVFRSAQGWLPVYVVYKQNRRPFTRIRHVEGDYEKFMAGFSQIAEKKVVTQKQGSFIVQGDYVTDTRRWLAALGF